LPAPFIFSRLVVISILLCCQLKITPVHHLPGLPPAAAPPIPLLPSPEVRKSTAYMDFNYRPSIPFFRRKTLLS